MCMVFMIGKSVGQHKRVEARKRETRDSILELRARNKVKRLLRKRKRTPERNRKLKS